MILFNNIIRTVCLIFGILTIAAIPFILFNEVYFNYSYKIDADLASKFGGFFGGFIGTLFSIMSVLLLIYTITSQFIETAKNSARGRFFKMLDYHSENLKSIRVPSLEVSKQDVIEEGRRAFVVYKIQLKRLLKSIEEVNLELDLGLTDAQKIDIAYICFYYGQNDTWIDFTRKKLSLHTGSAVIAEMMLEKVKSSPNLKLGRTNQTDLSSYFRNMYNTIKLVHNDKYLSINEKKDLVKIYRAQLSNPELYILFFNLSSRFGKKWNDNGYINQYEILTNLPLDYCDGYDPKQFFDMHFEEDEEELWVS